MKNYHLRLFAAIGILATIGTFSACKKDNPTPVKQTDPTPVLVFESGPYACDVGASAPCTWTASSSIPAGGAISYSITPTSVATINATTGAITTVAAGTATVTATQAALSGKNVSATISFTLTVTGLSITSFSPEIGGVGYTVVITGTQFDTTPANNIVTICGVQTATPTAVSATSLTVLVPKGASGPGEIKVTKGTQVASKGTFTEYATVTTLAGDGTQNFKDGVGTAAQFYGPAGLAIDNAGNLIVADASNNRIRSIVISTGAVKTIAGDGSFDYLDATGTDAELNGPYGVAVNPRSGIIYVTDKGDNHIRTINGNGVVGTYAGSGDEGDSDGTGLLDAQFDQPQGIAIDAFDNLFVTDRWYSLIREVESGGFVSTIAGNETSSYVNASGKAAGFYFPDGIALAPDGNSLLIADATNGAIRRLTIQGVIVASTFAGSDVEGSSTGSADGTGTAARFNAPSGLVFDASGNLYVTDYGNNLIRKITPAGVVTTVCGNVDSSDSYVDGLGLSARISQPLGITIDADGNLYVSDGTNRIRKIVP